MALPRYSSTVLFFGIPCKYHGSLHLKVLSDTVPWYIFFGRKKDLVFRFHVFVVVWVTSSMHGLNNMLFNCILRCYLFYEMDCVMVIFESVCSEWKQTVRCLIPFNWSTVVDICQKINRQISAMVTRDLGPQKHHLALWCSDEVSCLRTLVYSTPEKDIQNSWGEYVSCRLLGDLIF